MSRGKLRAALWTAALLACAGAQSHRPSVPSVTKHLNHGPNDLTLSYSIDEAVSFAHATCRRRNEHEYSGGVGRPCKRCRLTVETSTPAGRSFARSCDLKLHPIWTGGSVARQFKLVRFADDQLVLVWREIVDRSPMRRRRYIPYPVLFEYHKDHLRVEVVRMKSCETDKYQLVSEQREKIYEPAICGITADGRESEGECDQTKSQTEIYAEDERQIHNLNVVVNGAESFDLFFRNENLCGRDKRCKVTYDSRSGQFSSVAVAALEAKYDATIEIYPIVGERRSTSLLAYAVRSLCLDEGTVTLVSADGRKLFEHSYSWSPFDLRRGISAMAMSAIEESLGICQQPTGEPVIQCSLFDAGGRGLIGVDIALKSSQVAVIEMRNTFDGGFLLLVGYGNASTANGLEALDVLRVDSRGELASVHAAKSYKCWRDRSGVDVGLIEKSATQVCYYMACTWPMPKVDVDEAHWQLFGECFS
ncbi:uncharacterized protein LOC131667234 [Phymastichus coffea]|uniref:uncharacterized protein LOC131667234 n=1 Tax=Phymastichus coffea TaxID=108790 RepID=UPI00273C7291|nr:uncharacterized protein LOC131667234 [Phymastichus coffea]